jgi:hypothetical protein
MTAHFDNGDALTFTVTETENGDEETFTPQSIKVTIPCELDAGADGDSDAGVDGDGDAGDAD